jgi:hypothetical protein
MAHRMIVAMSGTIMAAAASACALVIGIEDLPDLCGEPRASAGMATGTECPGDLLATYAITTQNGEHYGVLSLYYDPATGKNCARAHATGVVAGNATDITVHLARCSETSGSVHCTREMHVSDPSLEYQGSYDTYAGPVSIDAKDQCIHASASILYDDTCAKASTGGAVFCD